MDLSSSGRISEATMAAIMSKFSWLDETSCGSLCQHPSCWASQGRQEKGIPHRLPPLEIDSDSSDDEIDLPTQKVYNILSDFGECSTDRFPLSTGGRPAHQNPARKSPTGSSPSLTDKHGITCTPNLSDKQSTKSLDSGLKRKGSDSMKFPINRKQPFSVSQRPRLSKPSMRNPRIKLVEVQEVFDREDLASQWDETFVSRPHYVWVPNPRQQDKFAKLQKLDSNLSGQGHPVLLKDLTSSMIPPELKQQREDSVLYDEWPVLKKRQYRAKSPPQRPLQYLKAPPATTIMDIAVDSEGISELLALPRETLLRVLECTKRSDFATRGKLHRIVQEVTTNDEHARIAMSTHDLLQQRPMPLHAEPTQTSLQGERGPVYQLDTTPTHTRHTLHTGPQPHTPAGSVHATEDESEDNYIARQPLPGITGEAPLYQGTISPPVRGFYQRPKVPSISLGLPELPSGVKTTRPFAYKKQDLDFTLGPVISAPSSSRSSMRSEGYSENGTTTIKVNLSTTGQAQPDHALHSVSPAFSTHVPMAPAGTPANFLSTPGKSVRQNLDFTTGRDPTITTVNLSEQVGPPSTVLSSPMRRLQTISPLNAERTMSTLEEQVLDTIRETARENVDESVTSSHAQLTDQAPLTPFEPSPREPSPRSHIPEVPEPSTLEHQHLSQDNTDAQSRPALNLEQSTLRSIDTALSGSRVPSGKSVESCPSPEQWPLISEKSGEPRPSVSEPGIFGRSNELVQDSNQSVSNN